MDAAVYPSIASAVIQTPALTADCSILLNESTHAFTVLARIVKDTGIRGGNHKVGFLGYNMYRWVMGQSGDAIYKHVEGWANFDAAAPEAVDRKVEELRWTIVLLYAVSGFQMGETTGFKADFFK
ncbi:hypothetical protein V5O48_007960 [Marasmius crinis-equi]|uniref:Uncharacterized protein n=1 Tax=Marasmius crinis-equi TaxID=585013 RepID=A0ABR3FFC9_9AGAR